MTARGLLARVAALLVVGVGVALPVAYVWFQEAERSVVVGAHEATMSPNFSGHVTIGAGPLLPELRLSSPAPLSIGLDIVLRDSPVTDLQEILARDAAIASQPDGEIARISGEVTDLATDALVKGAAAGVFAMIVATAAWRAIGPARRRDLLDQWPPGPREGGVMVTMTVAALVALWVFLPHGGATRDVAWVPIRDEFPRLPQDPRLENVEISVGAATSGGKALVDGAVSTYTASLEFYNELAEKTRDIEVRQPEEGQTTALVVTDRHDNIGMDPVAKAVADAAQASFVIDLGDDTSTGASWEAFSLSSLRETFKELPILAVAGNHDTGDFIRDQMDQLDFTVLDGEPIEFEGITFLGESDPRSSGLTAGYEGDPDENNATIRAQAQRLAEVACTPERTVSVIAVHSAASSKAAAEAGCADLTIAGHLHRQVGPDLVEGEYGRTTTLVTGSTGGAIYAFSLGTKLRRDAQVTLLTFEDGRAVGLQVVTFEPGAIIDVGEYVPVGPALPDTVDAP